MTYLGGERAVPHYNVMGVAKAALEPSVRYLAMELGPKNIRVNAISAGPIRTLAARSISGFTVMEEEMEKRAPMRRNVDAGEVGRRRFSCAVRCSRHHRRSPLRGRRLSHYRVDELWSAAVFAALDQAGSRHLPIAPLASKAAKTAALQN